MKTTVAMFLVVLLIAGCYPPAKPTERIDIKQYLQYPPQKQRFEQSVLGLSSKEVVAILGVPKQVVENNQHGILAWCYHYTSELNHRNKEGVSNVVLYFRDNTVYKVDW